MQVRLIVSGVCLALLVMAHLEASQAGTALITAVRDGDVKAVRALLTKGQDVNLGQPDVLTALHWAAHRNDPALIDALVQAGAAVNATNRYGVTPLSLACLNGNARAIERLLDAGAMPETTMRGGETVLMTAARAGSVEAVRLLIAHGANVNGRETLRGQTALMWAAAEGHAAVVTTLLEAGADLRVKTFGPPGAEFTHSKDAQKRPMPRIDVFTALQFAVRAGHVEAARALLAGGADVNDTAPDGMSALVLAIANAKYEMAAFLLEQGADPNAAAQGWPPLYQLVRTRNLNINYIPHPEPTGRLTSMELASVLVKRGAAVDGRLTKSLSDGYRGGWAQMGATPFLLAAKGSDAAMMRFLAANGADVRLTSGKGTTALMLAAGVEMFNPGEDGGTNEEALEAVTVALELGIDVDVVNKDGDTALHGAVWRNAGEIVHLLAARGASLDVKNKLGLTPWQIANGEEQKTGGVPVRPAANAALRQVMAERGMTPPEIRSKEERYATPVAPTVPTAPNRR